MSCHMLLNRKAIDGRLVTVQVLLKGYCNKNPYKEVAIQCC